MKKQISRLKEPSLKCIDLVVQELTNVVRYTAEKVKGGWEDASIASACTSSFVPFLSTSSIVNCTHLPHFLCIENLESGLRLFV